MKESLKQEIQSLINICELECSIDEFENLVDWHYISIYQQLSEPFIEKYVHKVYWYNISTYQKLSENFIEKFKNKVNWNHISIYQKLSESFIEKYKNYIYWPYISKYQQLSEDFISKNKNKVSWNCICIYQKLSESFIEKNKYYIDWNCISIYQKLSPSFRKKYNLRIPKHNTMYMTNQEITNLIPDCYQRKGDYIIAYKNIRKDRYSHYNFQYCYEKGGLYESHCDCNNDHENSFGLSLWTYEKARDYNFNGIVVKCRVKIEDIGAVVHAGNKLRCKKIEILK